MEVRTSLNLNCNITGLRFRDSKPGRHDYFPDIGNFILSVPVIVKPILGQQDGCYHQTDGYTFYDP